MTNDQTKINSNERLKKANKVTINGTLLNILLSIIKITVGVFGNSQAMIADGIHSLSDVGSDIAVFAGMFLASAPKDSDHNYGHGKFETLSTLIIGLILGTVGIGIGYSSTSTIIGLLQGEQLDKPHILPLIAAIVSVIVKEGLFRYTIKEGRNINSPAVIANAYHHRSDAYSSIGTAFGIGGAIILGNKWVILDPLAGLIVCVFILKEAIQIIKNSLNELLEAAIPMEMQKVILDSANSVPGVYRPHNLRTRRIGNIFAIDLHICVKPYTSVENAHFISDNVEQKIRTKLGNGTVFNIHIDPCKM